MTVVESVTLEVPDPALARAFYAEAFGLGDQVRLRAAEAPTTGFRGFTLSLVVSQPGTVAKASGVPAEGTGSHRLVIKSDAGTFHDPDGFTWELGEPAEPTRAATHLQYSPAT